MSRVAGKRGVASSGGSKKEGQKEEECEGQDNDHTREEAVKRH